MQGLNFSELSQVKNLDDLCAKHNVPLVSFKDFTPFCTQCRKEAIENDNIALSELAASREMRRRTVEVLKRKSVLPDESLWKVSFDSYVADGAESEKAKKNARHFAGEYLKGGNFNTIITGPPGVGKSHLAMSILKAVNDHSKPFRSCLFISINEVLRMVRNSFNQKDSKDTEFNLTRLIGQVDLLVLDDLGSESSFRKENREASEYTQQFLFGILDQRKNTIITTNLSSKELEEIYNKKLISRMYKGVNEHIIKFTNETEDKRKISF